MASCCLGHRCFSHVEGPTRHVERDQKGHQHSGVYVGLTRPEQKSKSQNRLQSWRTVEGITRLQAPMMTSVQKTRESRPPLPPS